MTRTTANSTKRQPGSGHGTDYRFGENVGFRVMVEHDRRDRGRPHADEKPSGRRDEPEVAVTGDRDESREARQPGQFRSMGVCSKRSAISERREPGLAEGRQHSLPRTRVGGVATPAATDRVGDLEGITSKPRHS